MHCWVCTAQHVRMPSPCLLSERAGQRNIITSTKICVVLLALLAFSSVQVGAAVGQEAVVALRASGTSDSAAFMQKASCMWGLGVGHQLGMPFIVCCTCYTILLQMMHYRLGMFQAASRSVSSMERTLATGASMLMQACKQSMWVCANSCSLRSPTP